MLGDKLINCSFHH